MNAVRLGHAIFAAFFVLVTGAGCSNRSGTSAGLPQMADDRSGGSAPAVSVKLASWKQTEELIASHKGKVVVLDVWSTWCTPCMREFPGLVKLHEKYGGQVACVSLNCNYTGAANDSPQAARAQVEAFLAGQGATFDNVICTDPDQRLFQALDAAAIPVVRVYDKSGQLRQQFDNDDGSYGEEGFTYEKHIGPLVEKLLAE